MCVLDAPAHTGPKHSDNFIKGHSLQRACSICSVTHDYFIASITAFEILFQSSEFRSGSGASPLCNSCFAVTSSHRLTVSPGYLLSCCGFRRPCPAICGTIFPLTVCEKVADAVHGTPHSCQNNHCLSPCSHASAILPLTQVPHVCRQAGPLHSPGVHPHPQLQRQAIHRAWHMGRLTLSCQSKVNHGSSVGGVVVQQARTRHVAIT